MVGSVASGFISWGGAEDGFADGLNSLEGALRHTFQVTSLHFLRFSFELHCSIVQHLRHKDTQFRIKTLHPRKNRNNNLTSDRVILLLDGVMKLLLYSFIAN